MSIRCGSCHHTNRSYATYCANCGLVLKPMVAPPGRRDCGGTIWLIVGGVGMMAIISCFLTLTTSHRGEKVFSDSPVQRALTLSPIKAEAVYQLLAPSDVKVIVSHHREGIRIRGTWTEIRVLERFAEMLMRCEKYDVPDARNYIQQLMSQSKFCREFRLTRKKAGLLTRALSFKDIPAIAETSRKGVTVCAVQEDLEIINSVVRILQGDRLH